MFEDWANHYDAIYAAKGKDYRAEASRIVSGLGSATTLLDVACGTGEHLRFLRQSLEVTGVDRCEAMLTVARGKLPEVRFHQGPMESFQLHERFDAVTCLFASVGYLATRIDLQAAIVNMAAHLRPGGKLILQPSLTPAQLQPPRRSVLDYAVNGVPWRRTTTAQRVADGLEIRFKFSLLQGGQAFEEIQTLRLFEPEDYLRGFRAAGLTVVEGAVDFTEPNTYLAERS